MCCGGVVLMDEGRAGQANFMQGRLTGACPVGLGASVEGFGGGGIVVLLSGFGFAIHANEMHRFFVNS